MSFAAPAVAFEVSHPGAHVAPPPVLLDQLGDAVAALALALGALDAEHVAGFGFEREVRRARQEVVVWDT